MTTAITVGAETAPACQMCGHRPDEAVWPCCPDPAASATSPERVTSSLRPITIDELADTYGQSVVR